jgi:hypothetical protein
MGFRLQKWKKGFRLKGWASNETKITKWRTRWLASLDVHNWRFNIKKFQTFNYTKSFKLCKNLELCQTWNFWIGFNGRYIPKLTRTWTSKVWSTKLKQVDICERNEKKLKANYLWLLLHHWHIDLGHFVTKTFSHNTQLIHQQKNWLPFKLKMKCSRE